MSDNSLVIGGSGAMPDYVDTERPWDSYSSSILSISIADTVTAIGADAFVNIDVDITVPSTVTSIGEHALGYSLIEGEYTLISGFSITADPDSEAERYASANGIEFIPTTPPDLSGKCGNNATFTLTHDGILTIKGTGEINDFTGSASTPWSSYTSGNGYYVIKKVVIDNGITHIGNYAFANCYDLSEVSLPTSIKTIGDYAFSSCSSLGSISLGSSIIGIGERAFQLSGLTSVSIPHGVNGFGDAIFYGCEKLESAFITSYKIPIKAFAECTKLAKVTMYSGVASIEESAFEGCSSLKNVSFASTVESIGNRAFYGCSSLESIVFPNKLSSFGTYSFAECSSIDNIVFGDAVKTIPEGMFYNCKSLSNITIGSNTTEIGDYAFVGCKDLRSIFISYKVKNIGLYAIGYEYKDGEYSLFSSFKTDIEGFTPSVARKYAEENGLEFTNYKTVDTDTGNLTEDIVWRFRPSTGVLNIIGTGAMPDFPEFGMTPWAIYQEYIKQVTVSSGITNIGSSSFEGCYGVEKIDIPGTVQVIGTSAFAGTSIITAAIPSGVREIANSAFEGCPMLYTVTLPATLTTVGEKAFMGPNSIITVSVPQSVTFIGDKAFGYTSDNALTDGFILNGVEGSLIDSYASANGITFVINGYQEVTDKNTGCLVSIPESSYTDITLAFDKLASNLEPSVILAPNQTAILYRLQILSEGKSVDAGGPVNITLPVPEGMESYIVNIYAVNANGQFVSINYEKINGRFNFSYDTLGQFVVTTADLSDLRTITVTYKFSDGTTAAQTKYIKAATGAKYRFTPEEIEGYKVNVEALTGTVSDQNITLEFIYTEENGSVAPPVTTDPFGGDKDGGSGSKVVLIVIVIILIIALIAAIILLLYLKSRKDKQAKATRRTMAAAAKKQNDGDILAKTMVVPDFATREIDIESLFADDPEEDLDAEENLKKKK